ncbi:hypothetical protein [Bythopirellula polymerisocia]|uniref:Right handed beta helix domain-containing protein n=1 Tax=Bythopirellula polymerisocia TaxID=2528003 RepID=A0A5C6CX29_9BACT|nr:hypothetical protein [Bythopirellula polymerisocia]TWU28127.1 hypothetical protein Pla144_14140 [Bythopirellula polymerisocia]
MDRIHRAWLAWLFSAIFSTTVLAQTFYVATNGNDATGDGSLATPWASIGGALGKLHDGNFDSATVLVRPGIYTGRQSLVGTFAQGVTVRSEVPYQAQLRHTSQAVVAYVNGRGASGITFEGFDIAHSGPGASPLVFHIDGGGGNNGVGNLTVRNNVIHDSYNNDLLKVNNGVTNVVVEQNMFYNQTGSDEHIDVNSVEDVTISDNVFFNDFAGSGRTKSNNTSSYIVIKDSNDNEDFFLGSDRVTVQRNVFLNWEGSTGSNFVLVGEDAKPFIEARNVMFENNLMLGNSTNVMRAAVGVKSGENITFRNNTIAGDLPALAYAMRVNVENSVVTNEQIHFYNNIWSDPTGTMGASFGSGNDFSDSPPGEVTNWTLVNNQYYNGGANIPADASETINYTDDPNRIAGNPGLASQAGLTLPRWNPATGMFADGSMNIREAFVKLVMQYGVPAASSEGVDHALAAQAPLDDILGNLRGVSPDVGAVEMLRSGTGDFDGDRDVDGRDFLVWQRNPTAGDLTDWQAQYGSAVILSVPEPSGWVHWIALMVVGGMRMCLAKGTRSAPPR